MWPNAMCFKMRADASRCVTTVMYANALRCLLMRWTIECLQMTWNAVCHYMQDHTLWMWRDALDTTCVVMRSNVELLACMLMKLNALRCSVTGMNPNTFACARSVHASLSIQIRADACECGPSKCVMMCRNAYLMHGDVQSLFMQYNTTLCTPQIRSVFNALKWRWHCSRVQRCFKMCQKCMLMGSSNNT